MLLWHTFFVCNMMLILYNGSWFLMLKAYSRIGKLSHLVALFNILKFSIEDGLLAGGLVVTVCLLCETPPCIIFRIVVLFVVDIHCRPRANGF